MPESALVRHFHPDLSRLRELPQRFGMVFNDVDPLTNRVINAYEHKLFQATRPEVPVNLEKIILRCLEREPERRYPFIGVMVRELQAALYVS